VFTILINENNHDFFTGYVPKEMQAELMLPEIIALGAADSETGEAAGLLIAKVVGSFLEITWVYVGLEFRNKGVGTALIERLKTCYDFVPGLTALISQFPTEDGEALERLFLGADFSLKDDKHSVYTLTVGDLKNNYFWNKELSCAKDAVALESVYDVMLREFETGILLSEKDAMIYSPLDRNKFNQKLSMAYIKDSKINGILLAEVEETGLELSYAYVKPGIATALPAMLYQAGKAAIESFPPEAVVSVAAISDVSVKLMEKMFPNLKTLPVKNALFKF